MGLNRDKFRKIVGGITTAEAEATSTELPSASEPVAAVPKQPEGSQDDKARFAKRGRPKGRKDDAIAKGRKVKVSLFLSEDLINDLYNWAHDDRIHPGEMFERALRPFHEKEAKRRNGGKE